MRIYKENQRFDQWWLYAIFVLIFLGLFLNIYEKFTSGGYDTIILNIAIICGFLFVMVFILLLRLRTRIDSSGIEVVFHPLSFTRKKFYWKNIKNIYVRKYSPIAEYGGWGLRFLGSKKAYNVSGNYGIQIVTKDKKGFLIGTQKPEFAKAFLKKMKDTLEYQND